MKAERKNENEPREVAARYYINAKGQLVMATLVEDNENPDGIFMMQNFQEMAPPPIGTHRPFGRLKRLPDEEIKVRIVEGDVLEENPTLEQINRVIGFWDDFFPLPNPET